MLSDGRLVAFLLPLSILATQCDQTELPDGPRCDCVCSNERVPECYAPQNGNCPPSPSCTSDAECDAFCKSDALCGEADPKYVACSNDRAGVIELHCEQIPQCQGVTETECRKRFERFGCEFEWLFYRLCVSQEGCGSVECSDDLKGWEDCEATEVGGASDSAW